MLESSSNKVPLRSSATAATGQARPAQSNFHANGTSMMISLSIGLALFLTSWTYLVPAKPIQPAKYKNPMVGICMWIFVDNNKFSILPMRNRSR